MSEELKVCPFCQDGGTISIDSVDLNESWVWCEKCGAETSTYPSASEAIAAWNTRAKPVVKALVFDKYGEAKAGGAKYCIYESGSQGLWNCVCYPHEDVQYRIAEGVSRDEAVKLANEDQTRRVLACLEGYDD